MISEIWPIGQGKIIIYQYLCATFFVVKIPKNNLQRQASALVRGRNHSPQLIHTTTYNARPEK